MKSESPPPVDVASAALADAVAYLRAAVERLACGDDSPRERVRRALKAVNLSQGRRSELPPGLGARFANIRDWVTTDPTLETQSDRDIVYLSLDIITAFHEAVRLHALRPAAN